MFNATIPQARYGAFTHEMRARGIATKVDTTFTEDGQRYLDVSVGTGAFNARLAKLVEKYEV